MSNRRLRLAGLAAAAVALTVLAHVLTADSLLGVYAVVEIIGGLAIGWAAIAVFGSGGDLRIRGYVILGFALLGAWGFVRIAPEPLGVRVGYGLHGALAGGAVGALLSVPLMPFLRWLQGMEDEAEEGRAEALAAHEGLVTPVRLPTWNRRFAARVLDTLLLLGPGLLLEVATGADWLLLALVLWPLYDIVLHARFGATAGKALCRICVVDAGGAARVGVLRAARRWALLVVNVPFIWAQTRVPGDLVWSIDPRLSAMKLVYCGTILITAAERRRLRGLGAVERAAQLAETFRAVRAIPGPLTRREALVGLPIIVAIACFVTWTTIEHPCWVPRPPEEVPEECID